MNYHFGVNEMECTLKAAAKYLLSLLFYVSTVRISMLSENACKQSEYHCQNGKCVPTNRFCNSINDCGDNSDEPRFCTPCNRTYYGEVGITYEMEIHRPKVNQLPFACLLTFHAGADGFGDIVQITFSRFTLGRFHSFTGVMGCQDGEMQISETERPFTGGGWCGNSIKPTHYFSESSSVKVTIKLHKLPDDNDDYNYDIKIIYRMWPKKESAIRYGGQNYDSKLLSWNRSVDSRTHAQSALHYFLGDLISGTYCSRIFSDCDRNKCRLQSPNFPGLYPRNLTCYYAIRQHPVPSNKHALISIRQKIGQMISIQSIQYAENKHETQLKFWHECDLVQDYVTIYDGYTTRDPILLKFCGGGTALPEIISSGPEVLVEFSTSPFGTMLNPTHLLPLHGFQLEIQVHFVNRNSSVYTPNKRCEFWIQGSGNGILESPKHTLPPNTTCLYHLQGLESRFTPPVKYQDYSRWKTYSRYRIWLSVLKFHSSGLEGVLVTPKEEENCRTQLQIWDSNIRSPSLCHDYCRTDQLIRTHNNERLLARYCRNLIPRTCEHSLLEKSSSRPCSLSESFLSSKNALTLEMKGYESTALRPISFRALYEFVDLYQDGEQWGTGICDRRFFSKSQVTASSMYTFSSPKNVFLYGRGGSMNLSCTYRFEGQEGEKIKITINKLYFANRSDCYTYRNLDSPYVQCVGNATATLSFFEIPFRNIFPLAKGCLCSGTDNFLPFTFTSSSQIVDLEFVVNQMNFTEDYRHYYVEGAYEFLHAPVCAVRKVASGSSGELIFRTPSRTPEEVNCDHQPWLIKPKFDYFLYVKMHGVIIPNVQHKVLNISAPVACSTTNRVIIHSSKTVYAVVCPLPVPSHRHHIVEVFSNGWIIETNAAPNIYDLLLYTFKNYSKSIIVEFLPLEPGTYRLSWLEITKSQWFMLTPPEGLNYIQEGCFHRCPELNGCINATLWCDGIEHCPSGYDESIAHCFFLLQMPALYLILIVTAFLLISCSTLLVCCRLYEHRMTLQPLSTDTEAIFNPHEVIC